jgi:hypothetical protein
MTTFHSRIAVSARHSEYPLPYNWFIQLAFNFEFRDPLHSVHLVKSRRLWSASKSFAGGFICPSDVAGLRRLLSCLICCSRRRQFETNSVFCLCPSCRPSTPTDSKKTARSMSAIQKQRGFRTNLGQRHWHEAPNVAQSLISKWQIPS